ncbi:MAG: CDP-diacylglycerol--glycerol-3-phosphate 3-phosphatidyltransferase [Puniceicoccales bacterium]
MNLPNLLTLSRIAFLFVIVALLYAPFRGAVVLAFLLFIIAALTDWADGYLARKTGQISDFGKLMDALADKVLMVGIFVTLVALEGFLPWWCIFLLLLIIMREFLITGLRLVAASQGKVLAAEKGGKIKTVVQIVAAAVLLAARSLAFDFNAGTGIYAFFYWTGLVAFILAAILTVQSGSVYMIKYWSLFQGDSATGSKA